jgi:hypothetical protein
LKDFVKPSRNENVLFRQQVDTLEDTVRILEKDNEWLLSAGDAGKDQNVDMERYRQLKAEIKMKKEAKERIIASGFPEFKAYTRI